MLIQFNLTVIKRLALILVDSCLCIVSFWLALSLRLEQWIWWEDFFWIPTVCSIVLIWGTFFYAGVYREILRHFDLKSVSKVFISFGLYFFVYFTIFTVVGIAGIPRSVGLMQPIILLILVIGVRVLVQHILKLSLHNLAVDSQARVLIYGCGSAGRQLSAALIAENRHKLIGFLDDDKKIIGKRVGGIPVLDPKSFPSLLKDYAVDEVILAIPSLTNKRRLEIIDFFSSYAVHVRALPALFDLKNFSHIGVTDLQDLDVNDILGRNSVAPDDRLLDLNTHDKVVMVTGAGGSIGGELCRQVLIRKPKTLLLIEFNEYSLYRIHRDLLKFINHSSLNVEVIPLLANIQNEVRMEEIIKNWRPDTVYHAAAYKHVPLVEENLVEGINNNVFGTWNCANLASRYHVKNFIFVSTDKAVRPTNIMGVSKKIAELIIQFFSHEKIDNTKFSIVRFGNVLASSGSVVPLFREQIKAGGPVTVTDPEATRFFMTLREAAELVIQAGAMTNKSGEIFILDMGSPIKIYNLAKCMIELSGRHLVAVKSASNEIEIQITGLRPGEKLHEELLVDGELKGTDHPLIFLAEERGVYGISESRLEGLKHAILEANIGAIFRCLDELVPEYSPHHEIVDHFYKATI